MDLVDNFSAWLLTHKIAVLQIFFCQVKGDPVPEILNWLLYKALLNF